jgi:hypothetical protein
MFTLESVAIESNEYGTCRQAGKLGLWDPIKPGYKEYANREEAREGGIGGCQFSSQFSVNGWLILVQTPCERKLYARGPLPPPPVSKYDRNDGLKQDSAKTTQCSYCKNNSKDGLGTGDVPTASGCW